MPKRNNAQNIDHKLNRTLIILSIITCVIFIASSVAAWGLTTVLNDPPPPEVAADVKIYSNGVYYTPDTFRNAVVNGTLTFVVTITSGSPASVQVDVYPESDTQGSGSPVLTRQLSRDDNAGTSWSGNLDTTQLENGIYWFFVRAVVIDTSVDKTGIPEKITLSIFGFSSSSSGGEGKNPPIQIAAIVVVAALVTVVIVGTGAVIMYAVKRR